MKTLLDREKSTTAFATAARLWSASTAATLAELLAPELAEDETLPDLVLLQELFARALERRWRRLSQAHEDWLSKRERHSELAAERDGAVATLYRQVVDLRWIARGLFGSAGERRLLRLGGATSRDPLTLLRQAERAGARLETAVSESEPGRRAAALAREPMAATAAALRALVERTSSAAKEIDASAAERRRALDDFNRVFVEAAGWLEGTYRAAGHEDRGRAVRPSRRRRGLLLEQTRQTGAGRDARPAEAPDRDRDRAFRQSSPPLRLAAAGQVLGSYSEIAGDDQVDSHAMTTPVLAIS